ncbi:hypothetical protein GGS20DRAFT_568675 [Poronia punctata]|nr:hypothetical protein GGS20DRAFT_568675 [Poronia punctata]
MHFITAVATLLTGAVMAHPLSQMIPREPSRIYFTCNSSAGNGYSPKCCTDLNGQVGVNCISAHQMGAVDPYFECNLYVNNITGCCQTTGYKNPYTNNTLDLCAMDIDRL